MRIYVDCANRACRRSALYLQFITNEFISLPVFASPLYLAKCNAGNGKRVMSFL